MESCYVPPVQGPRRPTSAFSEVRSKLSSAFMLTTVRNSDDVIGTAEGSNLLMRAMNDSNLVKAQRDDRKRGAREDDVSSEKRVRVGDRLSGGGNKVQLKLTIKDRLGAPNLVDVDALDVAEEDEPAYVYDSS